MITPYHQIVLRIFAQNTEHNRKSAILKPLQGELTDDCNNESREESSAKNIDVGDNSAGIVDIEESSAGSIDVGNSSAGNTGRMGERKGTCVMRDTQELESSDTGAKKNKVADAKPRLTQRRIEKSKRPSKRKLGSENNTRKALKAARGEKTAVKNSLARDLID